MNDLKREFSIFQQRVIGEQQTQTNKLKELEQRLDSQHAQLRLITQALDSGQAATKLLGEQIKDLKSKDTGPEKETEEENYLTLWERIKNLI